AQLVDLLAGGGAGEPLAGAVRGGGPAVEGEGELGGDQGAVVAQAVLPAAIQCCGGFGELVRDVGDHLDPGLTQALGPAGGEGVRVLARDHHAGDPCAEQGIGAGAGAAVVGAGFEGDHGGGAGQRRGGAGEG